MLPLSNHSHTEIEESLLPDINEEHNRDQARRKRIYIIIFSAFFLVILAIVTTGVVYFMYSNNNEERENKNNTPTTILISLDGFRWDYLDMYEQYTPTLNKMRREGYFQPIQPMFPTKTFPNHYTIVTGLYPETHGIVSNTFFSPLFNATFRIDNKEAVTNARWWGGEPIWVTAQKQSLKSGIYFWPGSEAPIGGMYPTHYKPYDKSVSMDTRVDGVIQWLEMDKERKLNFIALYMEPVDDAGHAYGPNNSTQMVAALQEVDSAIANLLSFLSNSSLYNTTNIVIVSDHGMTELSSDRVAYLENCIDLSLVTIVDYSPNAFLIPKDLSTTSSLLSLFDECKRTRYPNITAYAKADIPAVLNFNASDRITPIVVIADLGWSIAVGSFNGPKGNHGYDNRNADMRGIFLAHGPNIRATSSPSPLSPLSSPVPNIDVYNFLSHLLHVSPAPNNGSSFLVDQIYLPN